MHLWFQRDESITVKMGKCGTRHDGRNSWGAHVSTHRQEVERVKCHTVWLLKPQSLPLVTYFFQQGSANPTPKVPQTGNQVFKCPGLWGLSHSSDHRNGIVYLISVFSSSLYIDKQLTLYILGLYPISLLQLFECPDFCCC